VRLARKLLHSLLILALVMPAAPVAAQDTGSTGAGPAAAPAGGGDQGAPASMPAVTVPPVQAPAITNAPAPAQQTGAPQELQQRMQQLLQQQAPNPQQATQPEAQAAAPGNTLDRNEFQDFIAQSTGQRLPLFGYNLFAGAPSTFAPVENIPVTPDYVIGPGDQLLIRAWGQLDVDYSATVDRNGMINIPKVGSIQVSGIRYQDITNVVRTAVSRNFRNFDLLVTMGRLRAVQIFVVGNAKRPGSYTVSSLSTLVNAVFAAGGPSSRGSMRAIQLKRGNQVVTEMDLYDLLISGDKSKDAKLLPGDVIYFPPIGPQVALAGSVNTPAIYELKGETTVGQLLRLAGGLTATAQTKRASIERIANREARTADLFALDQAGLARPLHNGDLVSVFSISPRFESVVTLRGHVAAPLRYPYHPGMRIHDLIPEKDALITPDYYLRKNLAARIDTVTQGGLSASVRQLADEINWNYAVIERLNPNDLTTSLIPFNLGKAVLENDPTQNLPLKPGDVVTVFSKTDVAAPATSRPVVVQLEGEVTYAGVYQATPGETLRQLVTRVGGVTPRAYLFGAQFTRESTRKMQQERLTQAINQMAEDIQRAAATRARNVTNAEEAAALKPEADAQMAFLARLRALKPTGRIVLELPENPKVADLPDIVLEDGDRLLVPQRPSMVSVFGTVFNESSFLYRSDKTVADYLGQAGGPRKEADKGSIYVLRADGSVVSNRESGYIVASLNSLHVMPGDAIVVPEDYTRTTWTKDLKDWTQIFAQFGLGVAALQVIKNY
jgi:polysaccharide export outer membrane protein